MRAAGEVQQCKGTASIPGGTFLMGCHEGENCWDYGRLVHSVTLSAFQVDRCDFTERQMEELKKAQPGKFDGIKTSCDIEAPHGAWNWIKSKLGFATVLRTEGCDKPLVDVTWTQADAICRSRGMRLWTEAEYEYLARGPSGEDEYGMAGGARPTEGNAPRFDSFSGKVDDVGSYAPKMWGSEAVYDLAGNVWKWVADWYGPYSVDATTDPQGPKEGPFRVVRGGSWDCDFGRYLRAAYSSFLNPDYGYDSVSLRCVAPRDSGK